MQGRIIIRQKISDYNQDRKSNLNVIADDDKPIDIPERFPTLKEAEDSLIEEALRRANGNQTIAAELLGISRRALNNRLRRAKDNKE